MIHSDNWSLHWDRGAGTSNSSCSFEGRGVVAIAVPQHSAHAIVNDGAEPLWLLAATDGPYDPAGQTHSAAWSRRIGSRARTRHLQGSCRLP